MGGINILISVAPADAAANAAKKTSQAIRIPFPRFRQRANMPSFAGAI
jgi:hypothetical protein